MKRLLRIYVTIGLAGSAVGLTRNRRHVPELVAAFGRAPTLAAIATSIVMAAAAWPIVWPIWWRRNQIEAARR